MKRKIWNGRAMPEASVGIGRKGAMPEPTSVSVSALEGRLNRRAHTTVSILGEFFHTRHVLLRAARVKVPGLRDQKLEPWNVEANETVEE